MSNDFEQIIKLESLAEMYFDEGKFEDHMGLWSEDEFGFESPFGSFEEGDAYLNWLKGFYDMTQKMGGTRHLVLNPVVEVHDDKADFTGYLYIINKKDGSFMGTSIMRDRFKKTPNGWKFTYRSVAPDQDMSKM